MKVTDGIQEYMSRDWGIFERTRTARNPAEAVRIADELRRTVRLIRPDWPSVEARDEDLRFHQRMCRLLRRADRARRR